MTDEGLGSAGHNVIGGVEPEYRNIISGNNESGIRIGNEVAHTQILGNYIGVDAAGQAALGNHFGIVLLSGAHHNIIGGAIAGAGNVVSGNSINGVEKSMLLPLQPSPKKSPSGHCTAGSRSPSK